MRPHQRLAAPVLRLVPLFLFVGSCLSGSSELAAAEPILARPSLCSTEFELRAPRLLAMRGLPGPTTYFPLGEAAWQELRYPEGHPYHGLERDSIDLAFTLMATVTFHQFVVNSTGDTSDANVGDGNCDDGSGACTLRAAIEESNALVNLIGG